MHPGTAFGCSLRSFGCSLRFPCAPEVICVPGVTDPGAHRQVLVVDPVLAVDPVRGDTPNPPRSPDPPQ
jgi:hypothetical protein